MCSLKEQTKTTSDVYVMDVQAVVKVRWPGGLSPLLWFEPLAVNEKVLFYA